MIKNRQQMVVNIASQLYSARDSAKFLLKDKYTAEMVKYGGILTGIAKELKIGILDALIKVSKEVEVQGVTTVMLMASAVELLEPETSIEDLSMKIARARKEDLEAAGKLIAILNAVQDGFIVINNEDQDFDKDDPEHLKEFYDQVMACLRSPASGVNRVVFGAIGLMDVDNNIINHSASHLELHPDIQEAMNLKKHLPEIINELEKNNKKFTDLVVTDGGQYNIAYSAAYDKCIRDLNIGILKSKITERIKDAK